MAAGFRRSNCERRINAGGEWSVNHNLRASVAPAHIIALRLTVLTASITLCGAFWLYAGSKIAGAL